MKALQSISLLPNNLLRQLLFALTLPLPSLLFLVSLTLHVRGVAPAITSCQGSKFNTQFEPQLRIQAQAVSQDGRYVFVGGQRDILPDQYAVFLLFVDGEGVPQQTLQFRSVPSHDDYIGVLSQAMSISESANAGGQPILHALLDNGQTNALTVMTWDVLQDGPHFFKINVGGYFTDSVNLIASFKESIYLHCYAPPKDPLSSANYLHTILELQYDELAGRTHLRQGYQTTAFKYASKMAIQPTNDNTAVYKVYLTFGDETNPSSYTLIQISQAAQAIQDVDFSNLNGASKFVIQSIKTAPGRTVLFCNKENHRSFLMCPIYQDNICYQVSALNGGTQEAQDASFVSDGTFSVLFQRTSAPIDLFLIKFAPDFVSYSHTNILITKTIPSNMMYDPLLQGVSRSIILATTGSDSFVSSAPDWLFRFTFSATIQNTSGYCYTTTKTGGQAPFQFSGLKTGEPLVITNWGQIAVEPDWIFVEASDLLYANAQMNDIESLIVADICTSDLVVNLNSKPIYRHDSTTSVLMDIASVTTQAPCLQSINELSDLRSVISTVQDANGVAFPGTATVVGPQIEISPINAIQAPLSSLYTVTYHTGLASETDLTIQKRGSRTAELHIVDCSTVQVQPLTPADSQIVLDVRQSQQKIVTFTVQNSVGCQYYSKVELSADSPIKSVPIDGTTFAYIDRSISIDAQNAALYTFYQTTQDATFTARALNFSQEGLYKFTYFFSVDSSYPAGSLTITQQIEVEIKISSCSNPTNSVTLPLLPKLSYTYLPGTTPEIFIDLNGALVGDCAFKIDIQDLDILVDPLDQNNFVNSALTLTQPEFFPIQTIGSITGDSVIQTSTASLKLFTKDRTLVGTHKIALKFYSLRYPSDSLIDSIQLEFNLFGCELVEDIYSPLSLEYVLGNEPLNAKINSVESLEVCLEGSKFEILLDETDFTDQSTKELLSLLKFSTENNEASIKIYSESEKYLGIHKFLIIEENSLTGKKFTSQIQLQIVIKKDIQNKEDQEVETDQSSDIQTESEQLIDSSTSPTFVHSWMEKYRPKYTKENQIPFTAISKEVSEDGILRIQFNKPIIVPPLIIGRQEKDQTKLKNDQQGDKPSRYLQQKGEGFQIKDVIQLNIEQHSTREIPENQFDVIEFWVEVVSPYFMEIGIQFKNQDEISMDYMLPEELNIQFKFTNLFRDKLDFQVLPATTRFTVRIAPQILSEEKETLKSIEKNVETTLAVFSISQFFLNIFLASGLKYMWNIVSLVQYVVYMQTWKVQLPPRALAFLKHMKTLAFFEFLPIDEALIKLDLKCTQEQIRECSCSKKVDSEIIKLLESFGIFFIVGIGLFFGLLLLAVTATIAKKFQQLKPLAQKIRKKLLYNSLIRYALTGGLKLMVKNSDKLVFVVLGAQFVTSQISKSDDQQLETPICVTEEDYSQIQGQIVSEVEQNRLESYKQTQSGTISMLLITFLSVICPLYFTVLMHMRSDRELDSERMKDKIGSLYLGMIPSRSTVRFFASAQMVRRGIFVLMSAFLIQFPHLQLQLFLFLSLIQISFLMHSQPYEERFQRSLEVGNEMMLILISYTFVFLVIPQWNWSIRLLLGEILIYITLALLIFNFGVIIFMSIKKGVQKAKHKYVEKNKSKDQQIKAKLRYKIRKNSIKTGQEIPEIAQQKLEAIEEQNSESNFSSVDSAQLDIFERPKQDRIFDETSGIKLLSYKQLPRQKSTDFSKSDLLFKGMPSSSLKKQPQYKIGQSSTSIWSQDQSNFGANQTVMSSFIHSIPQPSKQRAISNEQLQEGLSPMVLNGVGEADWKLRSHTKLVERNSGSPFQPEIEAEIETERDIDNFESMVSVQNLKTLQAQAYRNQIENYDLTNFSEEQKSYHNINKLLQNDISSRFK